MKPTTTEARLKRAHARASAPRPAGYSNKSSFVTSSNAHVAKRPKVDGKQSLTTPFGGVTLSAFPTKDPGFKVTTQKKHFGNESVGHKYTDMTDALKHPTKPERQVAQDLLDGIEGRPPTHGAITSGKQKNAAAKLIAVTHVSEEQRVGGSSKAARGALRAVEKGDATMEDMFGGTRPAFLMAKSPKEMREQVNYAGKNQRKPRERPAKFDALGANMSDSSGED